MSLFEQAEQFFGALNAQELDQVVAMISPSAQISTPIGSFVGGEAYREWIAMHFRALPDFFHEIRGLAAETGNTLAFELHATGTFTGPLAITGVELAPTGRRIDVSAADFWRFENGQIVDYRLYFDRADFFEQLGLPAAELHGAG
jgi:predicted ester cyclase